MLSLEYTFVFTGFDLLGTIKNDVTGVGEEGSTQN